MNVEIFTFFFLAHYAIANLRISTYNIWNVMFGWDVRKYRIARLIRESDVDIIGLQEVRFSSAGDNQVLQLQELLPKYKWASYKVANNISLRDDSISKAWAMEGLGLISKTPILSSTMFHLPYTYGPDTNKRVVLHAQLQTAANDIVNILVVHLSYDRQQQCANAAAILDFVHSRRLENIVIMGDFNTYKDFEMPLNLFTQMSKMSLGKCRSHLNSYLKKTSVFQDAWTSVHLGDGKKGLTFSNMPYPGLESRPDRILLSKNLKAVSAETKGDGKFYRKMYSSSILYRRYKTVIGNAYLSHNSVSGYSCTQDCGPNGSCRCGICVEGGNQNNCLLPNCAECNGRIYKMYIAFIIICSLLVIHLLFAVLMILVTGSDYKREELFSILGCNCCLCNKNLFKKSNYQSSRRHRLFRIFHIWPLFKLPPYLLLLLTLLGSLIAYIVGKQIFIDTLHTIYSVMSEEYFPSDHLMLIVEINV